MEHLHFSPTVGKTTLLVVFLVQFVSRLSVNSPYLTTNQFFTALAWHTFSKVVDETGSKPFLMSQRPLILHSPPSSTLKKVLAPPPETTLTFESLLAKARSGKSIPLFFIRRLKRRRFLQYFCHLRHCNAALTCLQ